jgi:prepilin-type N-terminal cleavage/methylation domain-containing protein
MMIVNRKGFSLLELVVVIAIIGTLSLAVMGYSTALNFNVRVNTTAQNAQIIAEQVRRYYDINAKVPQSQAEFEQLLNNQDYFPTIPPNLVDTTTTSRTSTGWLWTPVNTFVGTVKPQGAPVAEQLTVTVDMTAVTRENVNYNKGTRSWGGDG